MKPSLVVNSSPLIALVAALTDFGVIHQLVERFIVPGEVMEELAAGESKDLTATVVERMTWCEVRPPLAPLREDLVASLGRGEAAVIQTAVTNALPLVLIDEVRGRRLARLAGLQVIGSLGLLVELRRAGLIDTLTESIKKMQTKGIHLAPHLIRITLEAAGDRE